MKGTDSLKRACRIAAALAVLLLLAVSSPHAADDAASADKPAFKQEELEQMLAPIALYPDSLLSQMLMASTYPLEIVQADRWVKKNPDLKDTALTAALEKESWDASVKSLMAFPQVLAMMSENLDQTTKIGDAFIGQQKEVLDTVQRLRAKAQETGNLKTTPEQKVVVEEKVIVIEAADPKVVYVPTYSPTVVYGAWPYPAYPPAYYYPPGYVAGRAFAFTAGVAVGAAWGYAWGHCNWGRGDIDIDINRNTNINRNINRSKYQAEFNKRSGGAGGGRGSFQHNPGHRQGVAYRDRRTASQFGRTSSPEAIKAREAFRGRAESASRTGGGGQRTPTRPSTSKRLSTPKRTSTRPAPSRSSGALDGVNRRGASARQASTRGSASRSSASRRSAPARSGGGRRR